MRNFIITTLSVLLMCGCNSHEKKFSYFHHNINAAISSENYDQAKKYLEEMLGYMKNMKVKEIEGVFEKWPADSLKNWLKDVRKKIEQ